MAQKAGKGGGARKIGQNKRKPSYAGQKARTAANKVRGVETRRKRHEAATRRRGSPEYVNPTTGKVARRGTKAHDTSMYHRAEQSIRIEKKRTQRKDFSALKPSLKLEHRLAGQSFRIPDDLKR
jgi:hypothetical protein